MDETLRADLVEAQERIEALTDDIIRLYQERKRHRRHIRVLQTENARQTRAFHSTLYAFRHIRSSRDRAIITRAIEDLERARDEGDTHAAIRRLHALIVDIQQEMA